MTFLSEILQFAVLIPAAILALLPLKNKLRFSAVKIAGLMALALGFLIPFCGWIVTITGIPVNYILFPVMAVLYRCQRVAVSNQLFVPVAVFLVFPAYSGVSGRQYLLAQRMAGHPSDPPDLYLYECDYPAQVL